MGIFDLFNPRKQAEEITQAFIAGYLFCRMNDDEQQSIMFTIYRTLSKSRPFPLSSEEFDYEFNTSPGLVQAALMANAMIKKGIQHGVRGFQWKIFPNPFALKVHSKKALMIAIANVRKYGIDPYECFPGFKELREELF